MKIVKHTVKEYKDYNEDEFKDFVYFAKDKKQVIVNGVEYGLDLEAKDIDLISNVKYDGDILTVIYTNGKTENIELNTTVGWDEINISEGADYGGMIIRTHPVTSFSFKTEYSESKGFWYASDGQEGEYENEELTTITFKDKKEYVIRFVNNVNHSYNDIGEVTPGSVKSVFVIAGALGKTRGVTPIKSNENAKLAFHSDVTIILSNAFNGCSGFTGELILPNKLEKVDVAAFQYCSGFTGDLIIPESVKTVETWAFRGCEGFSKIYACEDTTLYSKWNLGIEDTEVIRYKKGEKPWEVNNE